MTASRFIWTLTWTDAVLGATCTDLRAGIVGAARTVLAEAREQKDFTRRAYASALLGSVASDSQIAELWVKDEPRSPDALLLLARVAVHRVLRQADSRGPYDGQLLRRVAQAERACLSAAEQWHEDPTPWAALLGLDLLRLRRAVMPSDDLGLGPLPGPWDLVEEEIWPREAFNREAGHRLLVYFSPRSGGSNTEMEQFCRWITLHTPQDSPLQLLPLVAEFERVRSVDGDVQEEVARHRRLDALRRCLAEADAALTIATTTVAEPAQKRPDPDDLRGQRDRLERELSAMLAVDSETKTAEDERTHLRKVALGVYHRWFLNGPADAPILLPRSLPLSDLMLLAYVLYQLGETLAAGKILAFTRPYATPSPWSRDGDPEQVLTRAYDECHVTVPP